MAKGRLGVNVIFGPGGEIEGCRVHPESRQIIHSVFGGDAEVAYCRGSSDHPPHRLIARSRGGSVDGNRDVVAESRWQLDDLRDKWHRAHPAL